MNELDFRDALILGVLLGRNVDGGFVIWRYLFFLFFENDVGSIVEFGERVIVGAFGISTIVKGLFLLFVRVRVFLEFLVHIIVVIHELASVVFDRGRDDVRDGKEAHSLFGFKIVMIDKGRDDVVAFDEKDRIESGSKRN